MQNSTDGSVSPKPRWCKGLPPTFDGDATSVDKHSRHEPQEESTTPKTTASTSDDDEEGAPSPPSLRPGGTRDVSSSTSTSSRARNCKAYMAWSWLIEDEAVSEPKLQKPDENNPVVPPQLLDSERELLCRNVELRLLEVSCEVAGLCSIAG